MGKRIRFLLVPLFLVITVACATTQPEVATTGSPAQLVQELEAALAAAKANQVDVLAPGSFNSAQSSYLKAKQALESGARITTISDYVAEGTAGLKKAEELAQVSRTILGQVNEAREKALKVGADQLGEPFTAVENEYLKLTRAIENDNLSYAQRNAATVQAGFRNVEIMAIKHNALKDARQMMAQADQARIQRIAPTAHKEALDALVAADAFIERNPYESEAIGQRAAHAEFMARRLTAIHTSSQQFQTQTPEASALYVEGLLARLAGAMDAGDLRDKTVDAQLSALTGAVEANRRQRQTLEQENKTHQSQIVQLKQQLAGLEGLSREQQDAKQKLTAEREFNERFNEVQRFFRPDEAEVYKQGNQLVIRMRGIQFPVGQATLTPENYTLLSKVQRAIQTFGQPNVTIEGHTDSTGSAQMNQELSQKRAEAVRTYLVANKTLPSDRIRAAGYGPERPLAPNTTPEGRAINRRIDVVINPSPAP